MPRVVVSEATTPTETRILARGNWMDDSGDVVEPAIPAFLGKLDTGGGRATRLDLANWLVSPDNPLTARVFVNRTWREFFGTGISKSLDDLGSQGEWPTHPELLDWLASEFMHPEWHAEATHRLGHEAPHPHHRHQPDLPAVVAARPATGRTRSREPAARAPDPLPRGGRSGPRHRARRLRPAGREVRRSERQARIEPDGYLAALNFPKREYSASHGDDLYRRGVYTYWQRTFLHPSLLNFDAPTREECTVNRSDFEHAAPGARCCSTIRSTSKPPACSPDSIAEAAPATASAGPSSAPSTVRRPRRSAAFSRTCTGRAWREFRGAPASAPRA